ncbi:DoxX family protein [Candidatus Uhrbacteria bacterium]|nr:DoxX family protein [Candidatus Uhrbacteria bacterium]
MTEVLNTLFVSGQGNFSEWAPFILRVGLGLGLISHGYPKLFKNFAQFSGYVASLKWPAPRIFALLAGLLEFAGSLLLIVGLFVHPVALLLAGYFILVMLSAHRGQKFQQGWELAFLYFVGMLALWAINEDGAWALASIMF